MAKWSFTVVIYLFVNLADITSADNCIYTAAVYEYKPNSTNDTNKAKDVIRQNLSNYNQAIRDASKQNVSIIVFPEYGLTGFLPKSRNDALHWLVEIPDPANDPSLGSCSQRSKGSLQTLKCLAEEYAIMIVVNMGEVEYCQSEKTPCDGRDRNQYNTNVVFDKTGKLLARYRKQHLYEEPQFDKPSNPESAAFDTEFGRFATFTCFDINFYYSSTDVVIRNNVDSVAMPTSWPDALPTSSPLQVHSGWAVGMGVNLLAANTYGDGDGNRQSGSGLYDGINRQFFYTYYTDRTNARLVIGHLPCHKVAGEQRTRKNFCVHSVMDKKEHPSNKNGHDRQQYRRKRAVKKKKKRKKEQRSKGKKKFETPPKFFNSTITGVVFNVTLVTQRNDSTTICQGDLCCTVDYEQEKKNSRWDQLYAVGVFDGEYDVIPGEPFYWQVCMLFKCRTHRYETCGTPTHEAKTTFRHFRIRGNFRSQFIVPSVLVGNNGNGKAGLLESVNWTSDNVDEVMYTMEAVTKPLISAVVQTFEADRHTSNHDVCVESQCGDKMCERITDE